MQDAGAAGQQAEISIAAIQKHDSRTQATAQGHTTHGSGAQAAECKTGEYGLCFA
jgi:hypothetical protein